ETDCFGEYLQSVASLSAFTSSVGFTGHLEDQELGLINMGGRMYDPQTSRFSSPDPLRGTDGEVIGLNPYAYVADNFVTFVDRNGFDWDWPDSDWGFGGGYTPVDPTPPGPWANQPSQRLVAPGPVSGPGNWRPNARPYNPVDEATNRAAAARVDYHPTAS